MIGSTRKKQVTFEVIEEEDEESDESADRPRDPPPKRPETVFDKMFEVDSKELVQQSDLFESVTDLTYYRVKKPK